MSKFFRPRGYLGPSIDLEPEFASFWKQHRQQRAWEKERREMQSVEELQDQMDQLLLMNMALWSMLKEKLGVTDEQLMTRMKEIDMADGVEDGKVGRQIAECPQCHHTMSLRNKTCLYCGYTPPLDVFGTPNPGAPGQK